MAKAHFSQDAEEALAKFYDSLGAKTTENKLNALELALGGPSNFYGFGGEITSEMKLGCLEYEYLSLRGLVELVLV